MSDFTILMYEDEDDWKASFEYSLIGPLKKKGRNLIIRHKTDGDTIEQDLVIFSPNLIMVDHDLGELTGDTIIGLIDGNPDYNGVSIYYYSGGESLEDLQETAAKFTCHIGCYKKEGDDLTNAVIGLA